jgi:starch phosphorylase
MSLIEEGPVKSIRMAFLSIVCSHTVNGVAALHTELLKKTIFSEQHQLQPQKIQNKTNGVAPRRWIHCCNRGLSDLISEQIGSVDEWISNLDNLRQLSNYTKDKSFIEKFAEVKHENKKRLKEWIFEKT